MERSKGAKSPARLDGATLTYCRELEKVLKRGFEEEEEKRLFLANVLEEIGGKELQVCTDPKTSVFLESLLGECDRAALQRFLSALGPHQAQLGCHRCGGHVLQAALLQAARLGGLLPEQGGRQEEEESGSLEGLIQRMSAGVRGSFLEYAGDVHGSFVLRTLLQVLGGTLLGTGKNTRQKASQGPDHRLGQVTEFDVPEGFLDELRDFSKLLEANLKVFLTNSVASPVFQVALQVLRRKLPAAAQELCSAILEYRGVSGPAEDCSPGSLLVFLKDKTGSRMLETVIEVSDRRLLQKLYRSQLRGRLQELALHPIANFTVQRALAAAPTPRMFSKLFEELLPGLEAILAQGHLGVLVELAAGCVKHEVRQQELLMEIYQAFHCSEPASRKKACLPLLVSLQTYEVYYRLPEEDSSSEHQPSDEARLQSVNYHGSLLVQHLLRFHKPACLVRSLADTPVGDLLTLACHPVGSHVFDALVSSGTISDKQKRSVVCKLMGHLARLACDKNGSRVIDRIWTSAPIGMRRDIAQELVDRESELQKDLFGRHITRNFALTHYRKRRADWEKLQESEGKKRKMFADLLDD